MPRGCTVHHSNCSSGLHRIHRNLVDHNRSNHSRCHSPHHNLCRRNRHRRLREVRRTRRRNGARAPGHPREQRRSADQSPRPNQPAYLASLQPERRDRLDGLAIRLFRHCREDVSVASWREQLVRVGLSLAGRLIAEQSRQQWDPGSTEQSDRGKFGSYALASPFCNWDGVL